MKLYGDLRQANIGGVGLVLKGIGHSPSTGFSVDALRLAPGVLLITLEVLWLNLYSEKDSVH